MHKTPDIVLVGTEGTEGILDFLTDKIKKRYLVQREPLIEYDYPVCPTRTAFETVRSRAQELGAEAKKDYPNAPVVVSVVIRAYFDDEHEIVDPSTNQELQELLMLLDEEMNRYSVWIGISVLHHGGVCASSTFEGYPFVDVEEYSGDNIDGLSIPEEELARSGPNRLFVKDSYFDAFLRYPEVDREAILTTVIKELFAMNMGCEDWLVTPKKEEKEVYRGPYLI
ncbi:MAG: hypothetical protein WCJ25_05295 [Candidatus Moraniibacteriota bacterium]